MTTSDERAAPEPGRTCRLLARAVLACLALLLSAIPALAAPAPGTFANPAPAANPPTPASVPLAACVARVRPGDTPDALLANPSRFDCARTQSDFGRGSYWIRLTPPPARATAGLDMLGFIATWQDNATLTARHRDGTMATVRLDNRTLSSLTHIGARVVLPLPGNQSPIDALLIRSEVAANSSGLLFNPVLVNTAAANRDERLETTIFALFAGLCLALLVYNGVMWLTVRERFQRTYCLTILSMLIYTWSSSGALSLAFPLSDFTLHYRICYPALALVGGLALRFFVEFLETEAVPPRLRQLVNAQSVWVFAAGFAVSIAPVGWVHLFDRLYAASFIPVPLLAIALGISANRRGSQAIGVLVLAWAAPMLMTVIRIAHALNFIGYSYAIAHSAVIAMSLEALLSSLAMASRVKRIVAERDMALAEERVARRLADIDPLTGLLNRRALLSRVLGWQNREPLRLLLIDIDHFKTINDSHGHDLGDEVLRELAGLLAEQTALRASIGRLGGEEFALVGEARELSAPVALAILSAVRAHRFSGGVSLTVSIGMAEAPVPGESAWLELYRRADSALYAAKGSGRNRLVDAGCDVSAQETPGIGLIARLAV